VFQVLPLFLLSLTDLLLALSWMVGGLLFTQNCTSYDVCYNLHIVEQVQKKVTQYYAKIMLMIGERTVLPLICLFLHHTSTSTK